MNVRRWSLGFTMIGVALLMAAATILVSVSLGRVGTTATDADGRIFINEFPTPSIMHDSPRVAYGWIAGSLAFGLVTALLIRFGGFVGPALVVAVLWLMVFLSILTIGPFLAPGAGLLSVAALLAIVDRANRRRPTRREEPSMV